MTAYVIVRADVTDPDMWKEYAVAAGPTVAKFGGEYIVRGGAVEGLENHEDDGKRVVVVRFPSMEVAKEWYDSPEYVAARAIRKDAGYARFMVADGYDG